MDEWMQPNEISAAGMPWIYFTPISSSQNRVRDLLRGDDCDWAPVFLRNGDSKKFPAKWATLLELENEYVFCSDHDRQKISTSTGT